MRVYLAIALLLCVASTTALPHYMRFASRGSGSSSEGPAGPDFEAAAGGAHAYQQPGPDDQRSPCPIINTLANHGHLPRTGKGITKDALATAFVNILGCSNFFGNTFASVAFKKFAASESGGSAATSIDLNVLSKPVENGGIEHFASLTRDDVPRPVDLAKHVAGPPNVARIEKFLGDALKNAHKEDKPETRLDIKDIGFIRKNVEAASPNAPFEHKLIGTAEACLLAGVGDGPDGKGITLEFYRSFTTKEQFPRSWGKSLHWFRTGPLAGFGLSNLLACMTELGVAKTVANLSKIPYVASEAATLVSESSSSGAPATAPTTAAVPKPGSASKPGK